MVSKQVIFNSLQRSNRRIDALESLMDESKVYEMYKPFFGRTFKVKNQIRITVPLVSGTRYYYDLQKGSELKIIGLILYASVTHQENFGGYYWMENCFVVEGEVRHELRDRFCRDDQPFPNELFLVLI